MVSNSYLSYFGHAFLPITQSRVGLCVQAVIYKLLGVSMRKFLHLNTQLNQAPDTFSQTGTSNWFLDDSVAGFLFLGKNW